jgi:hypothetical protein
MISRSIGSMVVVCILAVATAATVYAAKLTLVSDLISTSALGASANHTIKFTTIGAVPPGGYVVVRFPSAFSFPPGLDFEDIDMSYSTSSGVTYYDRTLGTTQNAATDGVSIVTGVETVDMTFQLNSTVGIGAGEYVKIEIGTHATSGTDGIDRIGNPSVRGPYIIPVETQDTGAVQIDESIGAVYIIEQVGLGSVDTTETTPPVISNAAPTGLLPGGTVAVELTFSTNEIALCRYATTSGVTFNSMTNVFTTSFATSHRKTITGLTDSSTSTFYIRCRDFQNNQNPDDYALSFSIGVTPSDPNAVLNPNPNPSSNPDSTSNSSGGGGGGSNGGDFLPGAAIVLEGYGPPGAAITVLKDGVVYRTESAEGDGAFSVTVDEIDRGTYTISVYATDSANVRSRTYSATVTIRSATITAITGVLLSPTVRVPAQAVSPGADLTLTGATAPLAQVNVSLRPEGVKSPTRARSATTTANGSGLYQITLPTSGLTVGVYEIVGRAQLPTLGLESDEGITKYGLGVATPTSGSCSNPSDLNCDGKVNLIDFSILLFNWNTSNATADINKDSVVNLTDFSIMIFNWTG